jgi:hypothetical protein
LHPVATAAIKALTFFCLCPPKIGGQIKATRFTGSRWLKTYLKKRKNKKEFWKAYMDSISSTKKGKDRIPMLIFFTQILTMVMVSPEGLVRLGSSSA